MKIRAFALTLTLAALILCGCGAKETELPEDQPYNHDCHGFRTIMETEQGYYTHHIPGNGHKLALRFYERDTEKQIFLCAKPECTHNGSDKCAATFKNLECPHSLLYNGAIYSLTVDTGENVSVSLYRAALDGTALTKVGDAFSASRPEGSEPVEYSGDGFIIHKGFAYISYHLTSGGSAGFSGCGLVKMDISNGKTEQLWQGEDYYASFPSHMSGSGDYVYYSLNAEGHSGYYRYDTKSGNTDKLWEDKTPIVGKRKFFFLEFGEDKRYHIYSCGKSDSDIERANTEGFTLVAGGFEGSIENYLSYEDKLILVYGDKTLIYSEEGEKLGEMAFLDYTPDDGDLPNFQLSVSNGKLYFIDVTLSREPEKYKVVYPDGSYSTPTYSAVVYSCPIDDAVNGTGQWKFEYGIKDIFTSGMKTPEQE